MSSSWPSTSAALDRSAALVVSPAAVSVQPRPRPRPIPALPITLQSLEPRQEIGILPGSPGAPQPRGFTGVKRGALHLQVDLDVGVRSLNAGVSQPAADDVQFDAGLEDSRAAE